MVEDPDAPGGTYTHWLVYGLASSSSALPRGVPEGAQVAGPPRLLQGTNDFGEAGYAGPCPPQGETHGYVFRLLALDAESGLDPGADREAFDEAIDGHVLAEASLTAPYARS